MFYGWVLIRSRTPIFLLEVFTDISTNPLVVLFILNGFLLLIGCFMETIAALSILVPNPYAFNYQSRDRPSPFWDGHGPQSNDWVINPTI